MGVGSLSKQRFRLTLKPCAGNFWLQKIKELKDLPCNFGLTGRVHEEECDESFSVFLFRKQRMVFAFFSWKENGEKESDLKKNFKTW